MSWLWDIKMARLLCTTCYLPQRNRSCILYPSQILLAVPILLILVGNFDFSGSMLAYACLLIAVHALSFVSNWRSSPLNLLLTGYTQSADGEVKTSDLYIFQLNQENKQRSPTFKKFSLVADPDRAHTLYVTSIPAWYGPPSTNKQQQNSLHSA